MVILRLARFGNKGRPFYHLVAAHSEQPRDGRFLEQLGTYDPVKPTTEAKIDLARVDYWLSTGAQLSDRVRKVINELRRAA